MIDSDKVFLEIKILVYRFKDYLIAERKLAKNTVESYYKDLIQFYKYLKIYCSENIEKNIENYFSIKYFDDFLIYLYGRRIKPKSIVRKLSSISIFLKFLKIEGLIKDNPSYLLNRPKTGRKLPFYLSKEEVELLINTFDEAKPEGIRDRTLFELIYSCGLRVSEICNLNIGSIYFKEYVLSVFGKGSKQRYVPMGERAAVELKSYIVNSRTKLVKKNKKTDALFLNFRGERISRKGIWRNLKLAAKLAGLNDKKITVHTLRHSFATHLVQNGADISSVQAMLGHKNIITTEIYTHLDLSHIQEAYNKYHSHE